MTAAATGGSSRLRIWTVRLLLVVLSLALALGVTEGILRVFHLFPSDGLPTVTQAEFERVPGLFQPGRAVTLRRVGKPEFHVQINALGYRGEEMSLAKPDDEVRILVVGDSFTFGDYVDDDETLPAHVERLLAAQCGRVRAINAGVMNTTIDAHAQLAERGLAVEPDIVVLVFFENDIPDLQNPMWEQFARNRAAKSRFPMSLIYPIARNTATWNLALSVRARRAQVRALGGVQGTEEAEMAFAAQRSQLRATYADSLAALTRRLSARGVPFLFASYPAVQEIDGTEGDPNTRFALAVADSLGLLTVDLRTPLEAAGRRVDEIYLLPLDAHPRSLGHELAATALVERLREVPPLASRCGSSAQPVSAVGTAGF